MKYVELFPGISSSVLGFGCAPIMGAVGSIAAKKAIQIALEQGINHFDLARSYGFGEAEREVGKFLSSNRKELVIASKFGIIPNWKATFIRPIKPLLRSFKGILGKDKEGASFENKKSGSLHSNLFLDRISINPENMYDCLHKSLRELKTDYLDYFFIHEPLESIENLDELMYVAQSLKKAGKIRALGLSFMRSQWSLHKNYIDTFDILQFDNSPNNSDYSWIQEKRSGDSNIFFSSIKGQYNSSKPEENIAKVHTDFPQSVILISMFNPIHILKNAAAI
jgi:aryl-alcohol dehydrogenase-like predicted oxidoreductase